MSIERERARACCRGRHRGGDGSDPRADLVEGAFARAFGATMEAAAIV
jgi:hypothetical protein